MANCPRCGTADFYPSFSGKGECLQYSCELFSKEHFEKTLRMPATVNNLVIMPHPLDRGVDIDTGDEKPDYSGSVLDRVYPRS